MNKSQRNKLQRNKLHSFILPGFILPALFVFSSSLIIIFSLCSCSSITNIFTDAESKQDNAIKDQSKQVAPSNLDVRKTLVDANEQTNNIQVGTEKASDFNSLEYRSLEKFQQADRAPIYSMFHVEGSKQFSLVLSSSGLLSLWPINTSDTNLIGYKILQLKTGFTTVAFDSRNLNLAICYPNLVEIYSLSTKEKKYSTTRIPGRIANADFAPNGKSVILGGIDGVIYHWKFINESLASTNEEIEKSLERYFGHSTVVNWVRFHPSGRVFFSSDWYGNLSAWLTYDSDLLSGEYDKNILQGREFSENVTRVSGVRTASTLIENGLITDDGQFFVIASEDGVVSLWQVRGFKELFSIQAHKGSIYSLDFNKAQSKIFSVGRDGFLRTWGVDAKPGKQQAEVVYEISKVTEQKLDGIRAVLSIDDNNLLASRFDGELVKLNLNSKKENLQ